MILEELIAYEDDRGNTVIVKDGATAVQARIEMRGSNNRIVVEGGTKIAYLRVDMDASDATLTIGRRSRPLRATIRVGQDCTVAIGANVSTTERVIISAAEGVSVRIGEDCMIARNVQIRADDAHPIFDVATGKRVNASRSIEIGPHVWLAPGVSVLKGAKIGAGTVIGAASVVSGTVPNNCVAVGNPPRVVRRDIAWERPHLASEAPFYKPDASVLTRRSPYWNKTVEGNAGPMPPSSRRSFVSRVRRKVARTWRRVVGRA